MTDSPSTERREEIQRRAYSLWQQRGCPQGSSECDWLLAEKEFALADELQTRAREAGPKRVVRGAAA